MATTISPTSQATGDRQWFIVGRWQEFEGESRANLLRLAAVGAFYIVELIRYYLLVQTEPSQSLFHGQATGVAVAWTMLGLVVQLALRQHIFPAGLKYVSTAGDLVLLTLLAALANGPHSPLVAVYFIIIALAALRFSLGLLWLATSGGMLGYWSLVGLADDKWFDSNHAVPVVTQLITLLSLALTGIILGQVVRRVKAMATEYAHRLTAAQRTV